MCVLCIFQDYAKFGVCVCVSAESNLSVSESGDGHPRDPAVLQVSVSWWSDDLVQEVHP